MYESVPQALKRLPQWVNYILAPKDDGRFTKRPVDPHTGRLATWGSFDEAVSRVGEIVPSGAVAGIGIMFTDTGPDAIFGVDLDHVEAEIAACLSGRGGIVAEFLSALGSYAEISPSGKGVHILCRGTLPPGGRRRGNVEMYGSGRFFTVTGNAIGPYTALADGTEAIRALHEKYITGTRSPAPKRPAPAGETDRTNGTDCCASLAKTGTVQLSSETAQSADDPVPALIARIERSRQGKLFGDLMAGHWENYFNSQSEADLSLCNILAFWTRCDEVLMDRIFRQSALMAR